MNILVIVLRLVHILSGVFWLGSAMVSAFFLGPAVAATGEAGQKMMGHMITKGRMSVRITGAAILTVLAGAGLYWIDSHGLTSAWTSSGPGWGFGIGALFALAGLGLGLQVGVNATKLGKIAVAAQGKPSPDDLAQMQAAQRRMEFFSKTSTALLILALVCMATARYWGA
ncbi:MAG TPA: hypothetical protein VF784_08250 [Anaerolineales bacterium]